MERNWF